MRLDPKNRQVVHPFVETIVEKQAPGQDYFVSPGKNSCRGYNSIPVMKVMGLWRRTIWHDDGVVDITLEGKSSDTYRIQTGILGNVTTMRDNVYQLQDDQVRC